MRTKIILANFIALFAFAAVGHAQTTEFTYQGKLTDTAGTAPTYDFQFKLCSSVSICDGTTLVGTRLRSGVPVTNGVFAVTLDFPQSDFNGNARFLEIGVKPAGNMILIRSLRHANRSHLHRTPSKV